MNLLVTGGCGFIGSNFINYYFHKNPHCNIINIDAMYYCAREQNINSEIRESSRYKLVRGNIVSKDLVNYILHNENITHVIHFAAQSHVQHSFESSLQYTSDNILGTHVLLEASRQWGKLKMFIHVSTDEVYGESMLEASEKMHEESVLCPTNPYAATKAGAELIAMSYYHSFKMPIIITRGNNVYGPNQYPEKVIPHFIEMLQRGEKVPIQGNGSCVRCFLHVMDVVTAFDIILEKGKFGEIYNIGGDESLECSILDISKKLIKFIKGDDDWMNWIKYIEDRPFNDKRYFISNKKLLELGWKVTIDLDTGLENLVKFYKY